MDLDQIRAFHCTAKLGSVTAAAEQLYLSQPAVSLQIKALEREVGEKLFDRAKRGIRLTQAGEHLLPYAEEVVFRVDEFARAARGLKDLEAGCLGIAASDTASMYFLPDLLHEFTKTYPKIRLRVDSVFSSEAIRAACERDVDLAIVTLPCEEQRLETLELFRQVMVALVPEGDPLARRTTVKREELARERFVTLSRQTRTRRRLDEYFAQGHRHLAPTIEVSNFEVIKRYVRQGLGVSVVPKYAVEDSPPGVRVLELRPRFHIQSGIVYRRDRKLSRAAAAFLELARKRAAEVESGAGDERSVPRAAKGSVGPKTAAGPELPPHHRN